MSKQLLLIFILLSQQLFSQQLTKDKIITSGDYYYGSGVSEDEHAARDHALQEISSMIAVTVSGSFEIETIEAMEQRERELNEKATSIIQTYTTATLRDVQTIREVARGGRVEVFAYISKASVKRLYEERKQLILAMFEQGKKNADGGNLAFALKQWYFGLILLKSIPEEQVMAGTTNLTVALPAAINHTLNNIQFELQSDMQQDDGFRELELSVTYRGKPVSLLHYRFWDGRDDNGSGQVRDGKTVLRLTGASTHFDQLKLYPQYSYYTARRENPMVESLWDLVKRPDFNNERNLKLEFEKKKDQGVMRGIDTPVKLSLHHTPELEVAPVIKEQTRKLVSLLEAGDASAASIAYSTDPFLSQKLLHYMRLNQPKPIGLMQDMKISPTRNGYEARKLMVRHIYPSINKQSTEYLVLDFDTTGKLVDVNMSITEALYDKFVQQATYGKDWQQRQEIIKFVEKYRTAFHTRDLETISMMFADEALILVGRRIEKRKKSDNEVSYIQLPGQPGFAQLKLSKEEYLSRQKRVFDSQRDIFIDFSSFDISSKSNAPNVYGVSMRQHYASTTYADEGYLFLLIDFEQKDPLIYIRAWQPNEWDTNVLVNSANFRVFK